MYAIKDVHLWITSLCNSHCQTCDLWKTKGREELSLNTIKIIINSKSLQKSDIALLGGEITLYSEIIPLIKYLNQENRNYFFITNGILENKIKQIFEECGPLKNISFSLDAIGKKHDEIRGTKNNFKKIDRTIEYIRKNYSDTNIRVGFTISHCNTKEDLIQVLEYCKERNIHIKLTYEQENTFFSSKTGNDKGLYYSHDLFDDKYAQLYPAWKNGEIISCEGIRYSPNILVSGDVIICQAKNIKIGNIYGKDFDNIWQNEETKKVIDTYSTCNSCWNACFRSYDARKMSNEFIDTMKKKYNY